MEVFFIDGFGQENEFFVVYYVFYLEIDKVFVCEFEYFFYDGFDFCYFIGKKNFEVVVEYGSFDFFICIYIGFVVVVGDDDFFYDVVLLIQQVDVVLNIVFFIFFRYDSYFYIFDFWFEQFFMYCNGKFDLKGVKLC